MTAVMEQSTQIDPMTQASGPIRPPRPVLPDSTRALLRVKSAETKVSGAGNNMLVLVLEAGDNRGLVDRDGDPILPSFDFLTRVVLNGTPDENARKLRRVIYCVEKVGRGQPAPYSPAELLANPSILVGKEADVTVRLEPGTDAFPDDKNSVKIWWTPN